MRRAMPTAVRALLARPHLPIVGYLTYETWKALLNGPADSAGIPTWLAYMWAVAAAVGSVFAILGGLGLKTRMESAGLALLAYGAVVFGVVAVGKHDDSNMVLAIAVFAMCLIRMRVLAKARAAQEVAAKIAGRDDSRGQ